MTHDATAARCASCGMPLNYDRIIHGADAKPASAGDGLCTVCRAGARQTVEREESHERLLDLCLRLAQGKLGWARRLAAALARLPGVAPTRVGALANILSSVPARTAESEYDAMVLYSGGKDSTYMLIHLAQKGLRVCAWMLDPGYQSPQAIRNAESLTRRLGVPLIVEKKDKAMADGLFRAGFSIDQHSDAELVKGAMTFGSACWPCFSLIAVSACRFADAHRIPLCFIGTQRGQNRLNLEGGDVLTSTELPKVSSLVSRFVKPFRRALPEPVPELALDSEESAFPTVLIPFYEFVAKPEREQQIRAIEAYGWSLPKNTGSCSSNCMINELGRAVMRTHFDFDLYDIIDANERRLGNPADPQSAQGPDPTAVALGASLINLTDQEKKVFKIHPLREAKIAKHQ
ncbi:phosphoadenosine phosphosulfate reductase family protein [Chromobacterium sp. ASV23]|uniref:phosphoadenosine phosphosulfate reductase domain-containing protein n=1 Tax=Chromobacterium sp. ASV23 TaxID=2795110 RepID=UPI0018EB4222|nr:phosphoadenosine phosphosulfate reductase family protein [Chromobacterium sp. ASV23]